MEPASCFKNAITSLQIIFVHKQVIRQAKDKCWPDKKPVWSDKLFFCR